MRIREYPILIRVWLPVCALLAGGASRAAAQPGGGPVAVEVAEVMLRDVAPTIQLVGTILPNRRSLLSAEVTGRVIELTVQEGQPVNAGEIVCRLEDSVRRFQWLAADGERQRLQAVLDELLAGERAEVIDRLQAAFDEARAERERWAFEKKRVEELRSRGESADKEYNETMMLHEGAAGRERQAEAALREGKAGARQERIAAARHALAAQAAATDRMKYELDQTLIRAPFDGYITTKRTEVGQWIDIGGEVVELVEISPARVRVSLPEKLLALNAIGVEISVEIEALARVVRGAVARVIPDADAQARTFPVEINLDNADGSIKPGMFVRARMCAAPPKPQLTVPKDAVIRGPAGMNIWVVRKGDQGDMAMPQPVIVGDELRDWIVVSAAGLNAGDRVAMRGNENLMAPTPVLARPWQPTATTGTKAATPSETATAATQPTQGKPS